MLRAHTGTLMVAAVLLAIGSPTSAQVVPGTGRLVAEMGDDFEDPSWRYIPNGKKSSFEDDSRLRFPFGKSANGRWREGKKRGHPDYIVRIETPPGGLPGSKGSLRLQTRDAGIPGRPAFTMKQDDFLSKEHILPASANPSYVCRVYLQPFEHWENRTGSTFGFRIGCKATEKSIKSANDRGFFESVFDFTDEAYWPGMFIQFLSSHDGKRKRDAAVIVCRAGRSGKEFQGPTMRPGWWTLGISVSPDGAIHYYASPGVDPLTANDRIGSSFAYSLHCDRVTHMFFNVCSSDDTKTWSTCWIVDDVRAYVAGGAGGIPGNGMPYRQTDSRSGGLFDGLFRRN